MTAVNSGLAGMTECLPTGPAGGALSGTYPNPGLAAGAAIANIGYTPVNRAGDTMTGYLALKGPIYDVTAYGAAGDGVADDTTAIQTAINVGPGTIFFPPGTYKTTATINIPVNRKLLGSGPGSILKPSMSGDTSVQFQPTGATVTSGYTLNADVAEGQLNITLSTGQGANFAAGDWIRFIDSAGNNSGTQVIRVRGRTGDTITLGESPYNAFPAATTAVAKVGLVEGIQIEGLTFDFTNVTGLNTYGVFLQYAHNPLVANCTFRNSGVNASGVDQNRGGNGIYTYLCVNPKMSNLHFEYCGNASRDALIWDSCVGVEATDLTFYHGGFHIKVLHTCGSSFTNIKSVAAGWQVWDGVNGGRVFKLQGAAAYNSGSNIVMSNSSDNGLGFVYGCHHNTFDTVIAINCLVSEGLWFQGGGSHHNSVIGYVGRHNTNEIGASAGDQYNYVSGDFDPVNCAFAWDQTNKVQVTTQESVPTVASVATITLPTYTDVVKISGATTITSITASHPGRQVILIFTSTAQVTDGSNLKLAGNFTGGADRTLTLVCDGTNWFECERSTN